MWCVHIVCSSNTVACGKKQDNAVYKNNIMPVVYASSEANSRPYLLHGNVSASRMMKMTQSAYNTKSTAV